TKRQPGAPPGASRSDAWVGADTKRQPGAPPGASRSDAWVGADTKRQPGAPPGASRSDAWVGADTKRQPGAPPGASRSDAWGGAGVWGRTPHHEELRSMLDHVLREHPERPAMTYRCGPTQGWRTLTWHEFARVVLRTADRLDRSLGSARTV